MVSGLRPLKTLSQSLNTVEEPKNYLRNYGGT